MALTEIRIWMLRPAMALVGLLGACSVSCAQEFRIEDVGATPDWSVAQLKPDTIAFSDQGDAGGAAGGGGKGGAGKGGSELIDFATWARTRPLEKKFLSLFPDYTEPNLSKAVRTAAKTDGKAAPPGGDARASEKLYMYVAQARFVLDRPPDAIDLAHYVTLPFLERIDPAIKHRVIAAPAAAAALNDRHAIGNDNPQRKWCTGRATLICIASTYKLEGKIPIGILLANKLRDSAKKIADHIDFASELSALSPAEVDQDGLKELTALGTPVGGVLEQNIFYVNQIMRFGKFLAIFQGHPDDPAKTVVTAYMALAIDEGVFDKKKEFEKVPVLHNLVPAQVLMGKSSFNSGSSISAGLPNYARNEIKMVAGILEHDQ